MFINAPWYESDNLAFTGFAARQTQLDELVKILSNAEDPNDEYTQDRAYGLVGINSDTLTDAEIEYIESMIEKEIKNKHNPFSLIDILTGYI